MIIKEDFCLRPFNTFGVKIMARKLAMITSKNDLVELYDSGLLNNTKVLILSKGSNILFTDHFEGLVLLNQIWGKKVVKEDDNNVWLRVSSGEFWPSLVDYTVEKGWGGLENMTDIPGKIGAAPIQNIGAYGTELKDVIESVEAFYLRTGQFVELTNSECEFSYRSSIFKTTHKNKYFINSVLLKLTKKPKVNLSYKPLTDAFADVNIDDVTIADVSKKVAEIRNSKIPNPDKLKNAGSFFKNPIIDGLVLDNIKTSHPSIPYHKVDNNSYKISAAWLIEQSGWKGKREGDVGVYDKHALIIINFDNASGKEIFNYANTIQKSVFSKFGIKLDFEVNVV